MIEPDHGSRGEAKARQRALPDGFAYSSDTNTEWLSVEALREHVARLTGAAAPAPERPRVKSARGTKVAALSQPS